MYCRKCGNQLDADDVFCTYCGCKRVRMEQPAASKPVVNTREKKGGFIRENKIPLIIFASAGVILLGIFAYNAHEKKQADEAWTRYILSQSDDSSDYGGYTAYPTHDYENSTYKIGITMPAGEYVIFANSSYGGYFCLSSDSNGDDIIQNDNFDYNSIIRVENGEYLELSRCYAEPISSAGTISTSGEGMFKIGTHLSAGEYTLQAIGDHGYYCVYNDDRQDDIAHNDNFSGTTYVTVRAGQYLELSNCKIVD